MRVLITWNAPVIRKRGKPQGGPKCLWAASCKTSSRMASAEATQVLVARRAEAHSGVTTVI